MQFIFFKPISIVLQINTLVEFNFLWSNEFPVFTREISTRVSMYIQKHSTCSNVGFVCIINIINTFFTFSCRPMLKQYYLEFIINAIDLFFMVLNLLKPLIHDSSNNSTIAFTNYNNGLH